MIRIERNAEDTETLAMRHWLEIQKAARDLGHDLPRQRIVEPEGEMPKQGLFPPRKKNF